MSRDFVAFLIGKADWRTWINKDDWVGDADVDGVLRLMEASKSCVLGDPFRVSAHSLWTWPLALDAVRFELGFRRVPEDDLPAQLFAEFEREQLSSPGGPTTGADGTRPKGRL